MNYILIFLIIALGVSVFYNVKMWRIIKELHYRLASLQIKAGATIALLAFINIIPRLFSDETTPNKN